MPLLTPVCLPIALSLLFSSGLDRVAQLNMDGAWTVPDWKAVQRYAQVTRDTEGRCLAHELIAQKDSLRFEAAPAEQATCGKDALMAVAVRDPVYQACHQNIS